MGKCKLLPGLIKKDPQESDDNFRKRLYDVFKNDFVNTGITFNGFPVKYRINPNVNGYEEAFWHLTTRVFKAYTPFQHREFDYARSERIAWIKSLLENYPCNEDCCPGYLVWKEQKRLHIYLENESFIVVLEERNGYYLLVTAFVIFGSDEKRKYKRRYENHK